MQVTILGAGGFLGQKLAAALAARGVLRGREIRALHLVDLSAPPAVAADFVITTRAADISDAASISQAIPNGTDAVFHLAAVVSGQAEAEFESGLQANLMGTLNVLERCRALETAPVVVFSSSVAVYGGEIPQPIEDWYLLNPQTSYGTQKAIGELLINDYSRKGFIDGRGLRLPTVTVRPGKPNRAASSFASSIFREPLQGDEAICPVKPESPMWVCSPRAVIANLLHAAELEAKVWGENRCIALPGLLATIGEMVEAMRRVAGDEPVSRIRWEPDPVIQKIVDGWLADLRPEKATKLGFIADNSFEDNVRGFLEDDIRRD